MDSVSQFVLGSAVAGVVLPPRLLRCGILWGGALGTLPDLDVLMRTGDAVIDATTHRSWSHSLLVLSLVAPCVGWALSRFHRSASTVRWWLATWAVFLTHVVLDCCTVYGTQVWWPATSAPVSWGTVFVIDPLYTLPLIVGVIVAFGWCQSRPDRAALANLWGLILSSAYLLWTVGAQRYVVGQAKASLARHGVSADAALLVTPTELNSLLWRAVVIDGDRYMESYYSIVADGPSMQWGEHPRSLEVLDGIRDSWQVERVDWFTHGYFAARRVDDAVVIVDLRMGAEPAYFFQFVVGRGEQGWVEPVEPTTSMRQRIDDPWSRMRWLWRRIWTDE